MIVAYPGRPYSSLGSGAGPVTGGFASLTDGAGGGVVVVTV